MFDSGVQQLQGTGEQREGMRISIQSTRKVLHHNLDTNQASSLEPGATEERRTDPMKSPAVMVAKDVTTSSLSAKVSGPDCGWLLERWQMHAQAWGELFSA